jgi:hypothetical protein
MSRRIIVDIETGPLPDAEIERMLKPFDPADVKTGNIKDPDKISAKIADAEAKHRSDFFDRAALDPLTGRVVAIGVLRLDDTDVVEIVADEDESKLLRTFWDDVVKADMGRVNRLVGFNICRFDLSFLIRRSWAKRVAIPHGIRKGRYFTEEMIDLRDVWQCGDREAHGSLDTISKFLGVGEKSGNGADFAELWATDRPKAVAYLENDIRLTAAIARVLLDDGTFVRDVSRDNVSRTTASAPLVDPTATSASTSDDGDLAPVTPVVTKRERVEFVADVAATPDVASRTNATDETFKLT